MTLGLSSFVLKAAPPVVKHEPTTTEKALERNDHKKETRDESLSITPNGVYGYAKPPSSDTYEGEYWRKDVIVTKHIITETRIWMLKTNSFLLNSAHSKIPAFQLSVI